MADDFRGVVGAEPSVTARFFRAGEPGLVPFLVARSLAILKEAALVIRGATTGGAVDATAMVDVRLCPGTFAKVSAIRSLVRGARGLLGDVSMAPPLIRRVAARVMRGTMSG